jgi:hypothetical protein
MNSTKPYKLVILASSVILICFLAAFLAIDLLIYHRIDWISLLLGGIVIAFVAYLTFSIVLRRYIEDRIKLVYKTIIISSEAKMKKRLV